MYCYFDSEKFGEKNLIKQAYQLFILKTNDNIDFGDNTKYKWDNFKDFIKDD